MTNSPNAREKPLSSAMGMKAGLVWLHNDADSGPVEREFKSSRRWVYSCKYHLIGCPKYRRRVLVAGVDERLKAILYEMANEVRANVLELEVMPDHVHLLVEVAPPFGVHRFVRLIKGRSSRRLRREFSWLARALPSLWTLSAFVSTVGGAPLAVVKRYIENQKDAA